VTACHETLFCTRVYGRRDKSAAMCTCRITPGSMKQRAKPPFTSSRCGEPNVRFGLLADIGVEISDVRFTLKTGHAPHRHRCPLCARSDLRPGPDKLRVTEQIL
jgi:hypothetical protein